MAKRERYELEQTLENLRAKHREQHQDLIMTRRELQDAISDGRRIDPEKIELQKIKGEQELEIAERKRMGTRTMAVAASHANPRASSWPFVTIDGFEDVATDLIDTSSGRELGFAPIVRPDQLRGFEEFACSYFYEDRVPVFPNTTATKPFGRWRLGRRC